MKRITAITIDNQSKKEQSVAVIINENGDMSVKEPKNPLVQVHVRYEELG